MIALFPRGLRAALCVVLTLAFGAEALAQGTPGPQQPVADPNAPPPQGYAPPPQGYAPPPQQGYAPGATYPANQYPQGASPVNQPYPQQAYPAPGPYQPAPGAPYYNQEVRPRARISRGLMIGGIATFSASYGIALLTGILTVGRDRSECIDCQDVAPWLFIPVIGPFIGAGQAAGGEALFVLLGAVELVGAGLLTGGIIRYKKSKRRAMEQGLVVFELNQRTKLALDVGTSSRFSGPKATLHF